MSKLKEELYNQCLDYVQKSIDAAQLAIAEAQKAVNEDTKSSAGDKYETGREMIQQETNRNLTQLAEAHKLKIALNHMSINKTSAIAGTGSLVITDKANFYIAVSAGTLTVNTINYFAISPFSPIGLRLKGLIAGNEFNLNEKKYRVNEVF